jgi:hypothetical protein
MVPKLPVLPSPIRRSELVTFAPVLSGHPQEHDCCKYDAGNDEYPRNPIDVVRLEPSAKSGFLMIVKH